MSNNNSKNKVDFKNKSKVFNPKCFALIFVFFSTFCLISLASTREARAACDDTCRSLSAPSTREWACCPGGDPANQCAGASGWPKGVFIDTGFFAYCFFNNSSPYNGTNNEAEFCATCFGGSQICIKSCAHSKQDFGDRNCSSCGQPGPTTCYGYQVDKGACPGGPPPPSSCPICKMDLIMFPQTLTYNSNSYTCSGGAGEDVIVTIGDTFNINYTYEGTGPASPYEVRSITRNLASGGPVTQLGCISNQDASSCVWTSTQADSLSCPATPGTYDFNILCRGSNISDPMFCYSDDGYTKRCRVKCVAPLPNAIGYIRMKGPGAFGIMELRIISVADALSARNGMVKIKMANGIIGAADLMPPTSFGSANYSPVRVKAMKPGVGSVTMMWRKK